MNKKKTRQEKGITLIALIITIIVMLILVAVTINIVVNGGLFNHASRAAKETNKAKDEEVLLSHGIVMGKNIDQWVKGTNIPPKNKFGFYYDTPYSILITDDIKASMVFKENNKFEYYINGVPYGLEYWNIDVTPSNNKITVLGEDCNFSQEGKTITISGNFMNVATNGAINVDTDWITTFEEYHNFYYNAIYYSRYNGVDCEGITLDDDGAVYFTYFVRSENKLKTDMQVSTGISHLLQSQEHFSIALSMDGKDIYFLYQGEDPVLQFTMNIKYPWILPWETNREGILKGTPEDGDQVIYEKYVYVYHDGTGGYSAHIRDESQTFNSDEVLDNIYGVPVVNKNQ